MFRIETTLRFVRKAGRWSLKKAEILRGRTLFKRVAWKGTRLDARLLRCTFLIHGEGREPLQVAFKVPSSRRSPSDRKLNAVRRNRIRRLMKEGFSRERSVLDAWLSRSSRMLALIITYKGSKETMADRLKLSDAQYAIGGLCRMVVSRLEQDML